MDDNAGLVLSVPKKGRFSLASKGTLIRLMLIASGCIKLLEQLSASPDGAVANY